jgi:hypothetical protein
MTSARFDAALLSWGNSPRPCGRSQVCPTQEKDRWLLIPWGVGSGVMKPMASTSAPRTARTCCDRTHLCKFGSWGWTWRSPRPAALAATRSLRLLPESVRCRSSGLASPGNNFVPVAMRGQGVDAALLRTPSACGPLSSDSGPPNDSLGLIRLISPSVAATAGFEQPGAPFLVGTGMEGGGAICRKEVA